MKSFWLVVKKFFNEMVFFFRDFKWLIKLNVFCVKRWCLFCVFRGIFGKGWYKYKDGFKNRGICMCVLGVEVEVFFVLRISVV